MRATPLLLFTLLFSGCAALFASADRPEALEPVPVDVAPDQAYQEALALAFDRGYRIAFAAEEERLLELERADHRLFQTPRIRRIDVLISDRDGQTYVHVRYHSFEPDTPGGIDVQEEDRELAQAFVDALLERLASRARR